MKRRLSKRTVVVIFACCFMAVGSAYATLVVLKQDHPNTFTAGKVDVAVVENGQISEDSTQTVQPESKKVQVENKDGEGAVPIYVKVKLVPSKSLTTQDGGVLNFGDYPASMSGTTLTLGNMQLNFSSKWSEAWRYVDGTFYYQGTLAPGAQTPILLESVTFLNDATASEYQLEVLTEGIQAQGADLPDWTSNCK